MSPYSDSIKSFFTLSEDNFDFELDTDKVQCPISCRKKFSLVKLRMHIGKHILKGDITPHPNLCGYCGSIGCRIEIVTTSGFGVNSNQGPKSDCRHFYKFSMNKRKSKLIKSYPCSNRPVKCEHCDGTYWSYNLSSHYRSNHNNFECPEQISSEERKLMRF